MSFRDNLQHLRSTRNMTQEHLAMLLGVSRQSVSKWEAERAYPEMDKLLKICDIFGCTLDELVSGDLTTREAEPSASVPAGVVQDVTDYDAAARSRAKSIPTGIAIIIAGLGLAGFSETPSLSEGTADVLAAALLFACVAIGIAVIILGSTKWGTFCRAHPFVEDFYSADEKASAARYRAITISVGIAFCLLGFVLATATDAIHADHISAGAFLFPVALGVWFIVHGAMMGGRVNLDEYNDEQLSEMSESQISQIDDPERRERARHTKRMNGWYGAIMLLATLIALALLFLGGSSTAMFFWVPWPLGGIVCAIVASIDSARR